MMSYTQYSLSEFAEINPKIQLKRGLSYSFVEMKDLNEQYKIVRASTKRVLTGGARFEEEDTLFARITPCLENGKICQVKDLKDRQGFGSTEFLVFRGRKGVSDGNFVYYLCKTPTVRKFAEQHMVGTSGRQRVAREAFDNLILDLPSLPLQQRIASILSSLDDKIELNRQMNQTLEEMAQAMFKHYFVDGIDEDNLPDVWRIGKLENILSLEYGKTLLEKNRISGPCPVVGSGGIIGTHYTYFVKGPGIVVGRKGNAGAVSWIYEDFYPIDTTFYVVDISDYDGMYFHYYLLKSLNLKDYNSDSAVPGLNRNQAHNTDVALPSKSLAMRFNVECQPLFDAIKCNNDENATLTEVRDYLLPKLISGEIIPADLKEIEQIL